MADLKAIKEELARAGDGVELVLESPPTEADLERLESHGLEVERVVGNKLFGRLRTGDLESLRRVGRVVAASRTQQLRKHE